jgi:hypothetical protein
MISANDMQLDSPFLMAGALSESSMKAKVKVQVRMT